ncbi:hypothetical protein GA0061102_10826 [Rhizobium miluonense]|uniref:Uncharacterized protein n=1 Tax=Rhizobium miluonense TaxID=411945 RepID=A0A1C3XCN4_9HYPH|nr:hypothetical protein GA0061102_10826 [Rhizobium miluonense]
MSNHLNKPSPDLRTTPAPQQPWMSWITILVIIVVAALTWSFWPHASTTYSNVAAQTTTQRSTTTTQPATAPAQQ